MRPDYRSMPMAVQVFCGQSAHRQARACRFSLVCISWDAILNAGAGIKPSLGMIAVTRCCLPVRLVPLLAAMLVATQTCRFATADQPPAQSPELKAADGFSVELAGATRPMVSPSVRRGGMRSGVMTEDSNRKS